MKLAAPTGLVLAMIVLSASGCSRAKELLPDPTSGPHTRMSIQAVSPPSAEALDQARKIIAARVETAGIGKADVTVGPDHTIVVKVAGERDKTAMAQLAAVGALQFRKVLAVTNKVQASDASSIPTTPPNSPVPTIAGVTAKLGAALTVARSLSSPADPVDPQVAEVLKPFSSLTPAEVAVLPVEVQFQVPTIGCAQLTARPANSIQDTNAVVVACASEPAPTKYLLDIAKVGGPEVKKASATQEPDAPRPGVMLAFTPAGQQKWTALTREAYNNEGDRCASDALGSGTHCLVGIVLDNQVISAPEIQGVITGDALISAEFTERDVKMLAAQIGHGSLPIAFQVVNVDVIRP